MVKAFFFLLESLSPISMSNNFIFLFRNVRNKTPKKEEENMQIKTRRKNLK